MRELFWRALRSGASVAASSAVAGVSADTGAAWRAQAGGVIPELSNDDPGPSARLGFIERCRIQGLVEAGYRPARIAVLTGRACSTIIHELARGQRAGHYRAVVAQRKADHAKQRPKPRRLETNPRLLAAVVEGFTKKHSPAQIAGRLRRDYPDDPEMWVSHETIYQAFYVQPQGALAREIRAAIKAGSVLRTGRERRQPHGRNPSGRGKIPGMINISERPPEADDRAVPGHWEGDLILGAANKSAIGTTVERSSGFLLLSHLPNDHTAPTVADAISTTIGTLPQALRRSLTWDQGTEMHQHASITAATGIPVYFADPHSPWQRGSNENTNGLLRQYFPKGTDLSAHDPEELARVAAELNNRPRKRHNWATPAEVLNELLSNQDRVAFTT